jgi:hypothetical protein
VFNILDAPFLVESKQSITPKGVQHFPTGITVSFTHPNQIAHCCHHNSPDDWGNQLEEGILVRFNLMPLKFLLKKNSSYL